MTMTASSPSRQDFALQACAKAWPEFFDDAFFSACDVIARSDELLREVMPSVFHHQCAMIDAEAGRRLGDRYAARSPAQVRRAAEARERAEVDRLISDAVAKAMATPTPATATHHDAGYLGEYIGNPHLWGRMPFEEYA